MRVDVRIIAATNRDLEEAGAAGRVPRGPVLPPQRHADPPARRSASGATDIPLLVEHFLRKFDERLKQNVAGVEPERSQRLSAYDWPGNIRELENVDRARAWCWEPARPRAWTRCRPRSAATGPRPARPKTIDLPEDDLDLERPWRSSSSGTSCWRSSARAASRPAAAEILRMSFRQFRYKLQKHSLARRSVAVEE